MAGVEKWDFLLGASLLVVSNAERWEECYSTLVFEMNFDILQIFFFYISLSFFNEFCISFNEFCVPSLYLQTYDFSADDLVDQGEIGRGAYGTVNKVFHEQSNKVMAVKVCTSHNVNYH